MHNSNLHKILPLVQRPGRYTDNELNSIHKNWDQAQVKIALAYPDRSLQWINAETGDPMGTALVVSFAPPISDDNKLYMAFGVSADGVLYVGVADKIMR